MTGETKLTGWAAVAEQTTKGGVQFAALLLVAFMVWMVASKDIQREIAMGQTQDRMADALERLVILVENEQRQ